ncbi:prepilin-type N-terminal cleavage/methylation domain-containing protein [Rhodoferax sp.]|uniref:PilW family protein n=1 Tax=Rhodoferax sp. TaxID=50421 RepID=UPI0025CC9C26|nr:prepilin-type N-terminal cleavage/methylation domain-containing protein [Rhodoferax sp.]MCM2341281.1 prepilin-type N-terminal cleavage/methylation domain-containing protein [Rhodoferax sp.]
MSMKFSRQSGVGLVELMISLVIGMIVIAGALSMVSSTFGANASQMKMSRLNNELRMAMSSITRDMRRSGHNSWTIAQLTAGVYTPSPQPASVVIAESSADSAVMHYDENADGLYPTTEPTETYSFRYNNNTIETKIGTASTGTWNAIVDPSVIEITEFKITDLSQDLSTATPPGALAVTLPMYSITIKGKLVKDPTVERTIQETVRLRNVIVS